jgi:diketogulonate reductase-like aldo/keto reductase
MAYSPLGSGELVRHATLRQIGRARGVTAAQVALAWCVREPGIEAIPKSANVSSIEENRRAAELRLTSAELAEQDRISGTPCATAARGRLSGARRIRCPLC